MEKNILQKIYGWMGFIVFWGLGFFVVWSLIVGIDRTIEVLTRILF
jgi:hypothetical protein